MLLGPLIKTPFSDYFAIVTPHYQTNVQNNLCAKLQKRFLNCVEAYGTEKARTACIELFYDMYECHHKKIQYTRVSEIKKERKKKYKAGKLDKLYEEKPPLDSYFHSPE